MQEVTVYATAMQAVRRTADNCRRMLALLDAFGVAVSVVLVDSLEMRTFVQELLAKQEAIGWRKQHGGGMTPNFQLPLCFVGPVLVGTYEEVAELNETGTLPKSLRAAGYGGVFRAAVHDDIPVGNAAALAAAAASHPVGGEGGYGGERSGNDGTKAADADVDDSNNKNSNNNDDEDGSEDEIPPPPPSPPPPPDEDELNDGTDSPLHRSDVDKGNKFGIVDFEEDDDEEPPPPPPPDDDEEEEEEEYDENEFPPPSPPLED
ncbi:hypothetical protein TcCL_ESM11406 [Trypanosoma cruzi]|uniref:Uncharacterized protein n=1 Tax=Trypanosoma cruzi (strain CL Brener) TaxID=353153 RepID=Q4D8C0_TRYCC|nr:hypothetical protein, conserved [Trypanosoma cruzi]EAN88774.1 hypothetical protein, conserved [Trypanosoma cruzi]RNC51472.1 hypothetical protein TcCL_ESM11406 [Trypanosoma cruzi]|eukprot:XP_810625.1 hypothetical protein [Trypanosoma cruzi strain CL Brener]